MLKDCLTYLSNKIDTLGYFNKVVCFAEKIEREGRFFPAQYTFNEFKEINLDDFGSVGYFRKTGDVTITEQTNETLSKSTQYETTIPLRFVGFITKDVYSNDAYFADNICQEVLAYITVGNSALKAAMKAKKVTFKANKYSTDGYTIGRDEYENINFEPRYTHAYFYIDFNLSVVTNSQCYTDICNDIPVDFGYVTIKDGQGNVIEKVKCGGEYICIASEGGNVTITNSDFSYEQTVACGTSFELPDTTYNVYVDNVLQNTVSVPSLKDETINILWQ
jgi:hypothetical protein